MARGELRTFAACIAPCSVKAYGRYLMFWPRPGFKVANGDLESSASSGVSWNMKSSGKRSALRLTWPLAARRALRGEHDRVCNHGAQHLNLAPGGAVRDPLLRQVRCAAIEILHLKGEARQVRRHLGAGGGL